MQKPYSFARFFKKPLRLLFIYWVSITFLSMSPLEGHPLDELQIAIRKKETAMSVRLSVAKKLLPPGTKAVDYLTKEIAKLEIYEDGKKCLPGEDFIETIEESSLEIFAGEQSVICHGSYNVLRISTKTPLDRRASITAIWDNNWTSEALEVDASAVVIKPYEKKTRFLNFVRAGIIHLISGVDHVLFLLTLLISAAFMRTSRGRALETVFLEISLFTFAHGLSVIVAVTGRYPIPGLFVESAIAGTVIFSGLCLFESGFFTMKKLIPLIIPFGLIHGLSFAEVMRNMGLDLRSDWLELLGFNLGIEIAQLIIGLILVGAMYQWFVVVRAKKVRSFIATIVVIAGFYWLVSRNFL